jgi:glucose-6-phosphate 1-dehydrogenase
MNQNIVVTIFGATGDLTARKLLPALTELIKKGHDIHIFAIGRRDFSTKTYLNFMVEKKTQNIDVSLLLKHLTYVHMELSEIDAYKDLKQVMIPFTNERTKRLYYLAVAPEFFDSISQALHEHQLIRKDNTLDIVAFEKPFGEDLTSATHINEVLSNYFTERQMFRIDHYLGKEMIQNIMMLRFANRIFEDSWHNRSIKSITIYVKEKDGILSRAGYYDNVGALRDMMQSHVLQIVSLLTMDVPVSYFSDDLKNEKVIALQNLEIDHHKTVLGQYEGYLKEDNIESSSITETFVFLEGRVQTPKFKGIPIYMLTGKKLDEKRAFIDIEFEATTEQRKWHLPLSSNKLRIFIAPEDGFTMTLNSKVPGLREAVKTVNLGYSIENDEVGNIPEAYEKLCLDMIEHHRTLFTRWDEIKASWTIIDEVIKKAPKPYIYKDYEDLKTYIFNKTGVTLQ